MIPIKLSPTPEAPLLRIFMEVSMKMVQSVILLCGTLIYMGCDSGRSERHEAVGFVAQLTSQANAYQALNAREAYMISRLRNWVVPFSAIGVCDTRSFFGQNEGQRADEVRAHQFVAEIDKVAYGLMRVREQLDSLQLSHPNVQIARSSLVREIAAREGALSQTRELLQQTAAAVPNVPNCVGASPRSASDLSAIVQSYSIDDANLSRTIAQLRGHYMVSDEELEPRTKRVEEAIQQAERSLSEARAKDTIGGEGGEGPTPRTP